MATTLVQLQTDFSTGCNIYRWAEQGLLESLDSHDVRLIIVRTKEGIQTLLGVTGRVCDDIYYGVWDCLFRRTGIELLPQIWGGVPVTYTLPVRRSNISEPVYNVSPVGGRALFFDRFPAAKPSSYLTEGK